MSEYRKVSGCIYAEPDRFSKDGYKYTIRPHRQGWGLPTEDLEPEDLRALADELEANRKQQTK